MKPYKIPKGWRRVPMGGIKRATDKYRDTWEEPNGQFRYGWTLYSKGYPEAVGQPIDSEGVIAIRKIKRRKR